MATKKPVSKKTSTTKSTAKATTVKKAPAAKKTTAKKKQPEMQSFRLAKEPGPFMRFQITDQTIYWLIIAAISIAFVLWIFKVQNDINELYLQIERIQQQSDMLPAVPPQANE